jgi:exopolysaccharide biosynthesis polyprenyl glycosylphosphotransferase
MRVAQKKTQFGVITIKLVDAFLIMLIFVCTMEYSKSGYIFNLDFFRRIEFALWHFFVLIFIVLLLNRVFVNMGIYNFRQLGGWRKQLWQIAITSITGVTIVVFTANLTGMIGVAAPFPTLFWLTTLVFFIVYRIVVFAVLFWVRSKKRNLRNVIIVGINPRSISLARRLQNPELGFNISGFVDNKVGIEANGSKLDKPILCDLSEIEQLISTRPIDAVLIALPMRSYYDKIAEIIKLCAIQGIETHIITALFDIPSYIRQEAGLGADTPFISYDVDLHTEFQYNVTRIFDLVISSIAILVLSPVFFLIALIILLSDGWPVFFAQERIGLNKRYFKMLKFRTMVRNADQMQTLLEDQNEADGAAFKITNDPRITRVGKFLRKTSLDEIPQFLNVFAGSMSLVGPRPLPIRDFKLFYQNEHRRRFSVKPGITGLWQIGGRDEKDFEEWMRLDLEYVDHWSLIFNLKIFVKTFVVVLSRKGAC